VGLVLGVKVVEAVGASAEGVKRGLCEAFVDGVAMEVAVRRMEGETEMEGVKEGERLGVMVVVMEALGEGWKPVLVIEGLGGMEGEFAWVEEEEKLGKEVTEEVREAFTVAEKAGVRVNPVAVEECVEDPLTGAEGL